MLFTLGLTQKRGKKKKKEKKKGEKNENQATDAFTCANDACEPFHGRSPASRGGRRRREHRRDEETVGGSLSDTSSTTRAKLRAAADRTPHTAHRKS